MNDKIRNYLHEVAEVSGDISETAKNEVAQVHNKRFNLSSLNEALKKAEDGLRHYEDIKDSRGLNDEETAKYLEVKSLIDEIKEQMASLDDQVVSALKNPKVSDLIQDEAVVKNEKIKVSKRLQEWAEKELVNFIEQVKEKYNESILLKERVVRANKDLVAICNQKLGDKFSNQLINTGSNQVREMLEERSNSLSAFSILEKRKIANILNSKEFNAFSSADNDLINFNMENFGTPSIHQVTLAQSVLEVIRSGNNKANLPGQFLLLFGKLKGMLDDYSAVLKKTETGRGEYYYGKNVLSESIESLAKLGVDPSVLKLTSYGLSEKL